MISSIKDFKSEIEAVEWPNLRPFNSSAHFRSDETKLELLGEIDHIELESLEPTPSAAGSNASNVRAAGWIIVNIVSTILIVSY